MRARRNQIMAMALTVSVAFSTIMPSAVVYAEDYETDWGTLEQISEEWTDDVDDTVVLVEEDEASSEDTDADPSDEEDGVVYSGDNIEETLEDDLWEELIIDGDEAVAALLADDTAEPFAYDGDAVNFISVGGTPFMMFAPQEGTEAKIDGENVVITYIPKSTTIYGWIHWGTISDEDLSKDVALEEDGKFTITLSKDKCGWAIPIAPIKIKDGKASKDQYYLAIPAENKLIEADYTAVDAALAKVPEDLSIYTKETAKALEDAVNAVDRTKKASEQDAVNAMAKAIEDAIAALKKEIRIAYSGSVISFYKIDGISEFGMLSAQDGSAFVLDGDFVRIYIVPSNKTVYGWLHWGLITDEDLTKDEALQDNGYVVLSINKENCGYGIPVAPIKKNGGGTTKDQYYLCIPAEDKIAKIADYTAVDAALAKVPANLTGYTQETAKAVTDAVEAVFRYKNESQQADVNAMAKAIEAAVASLKEKTADYTAVDTALKKIPTDLSKYTDDTVKAVNSAKTAVVRNLPISKQSQVDAMAKKIETAVAGLKKKPVAAPAGTKFTQGGAGYKVLAGSKTVSCTGPTNKKATSVTIPGTVTVNGITYKVTKIAANAFKNCKKLKSVKINGNITAIGKSAFQNCTVLKSVAIPKNVTSIGASAFAGCKSLTKVTIKSSNLKTIGKNAFSKAGSKNYKKLTVKVPKKQLKSYAKKLGKAKLSTKAKVTK